MSSRREFMETVAALAAARGEPEWENQEQIEEDDVWGPEHGVYNTGEFTPSFFGVHAWGMIADLDVDDPQLDARNLTVNYDNRSVYFTIEGDGEDVEAGALVEFGVDEAKEIAAALYQAAEEHEALARER